MAIMNFAGKKPGKIKPGITISDILISEYPKKGKSLIEYFNNRKDVFKNKNIDNEVDENSGVMVERNIKELIIN
jgi:hypothetical protein